MRVAVIGAGAVGSVVGGLLAERGEDVTLIGRRPHVHAIQQNGLRLDDSGERVISVRAAESLNESPDLAIFAVKTQDLDQACRDTAPLIGSSPVVTMQNGVRCDEIARRHFAPEQIVGCVVFSMVAFTKPGRVSRHVRGWLSLGAPFETLAPVREVEAVLKKALPTRISRDIATARWTKLVGNLNNALPAATGLPLQEIYFSPHTSRLPLRLMREGLQTISAAGIPIGRSPHALAMRLATGLPEPLPLAGFRLAARTRLGKLPMLGSTWQSLARGSRSTEIDYLNAEIVRLGERLGHPTPYNKRAVQLVHDVEESGRFYPPEKLWPV